VSRLSSPIEIEIFGQSSCRFFNIVLIESLDQEHVEKQDFRVSRLSRLGFLNCPDLLDCQDIIFLNCRDQESL
jgi:hypothetical protein